LNHDLAQVFLGNYIVNIHSNLQALPHNLMECLDRVCHCFR